MNDMQLAIIKQQLDEFGRLVDEARTSLNEYKLKTESRIEKLYERKMALQRSFDELKTADERTTRLAAQETNRLREEVNLLRNSQGGMAQVSSAMDATQLQRQVTALEAKLADRERELLAAKARIDELQQSQSFKNQQLMAKIARLDSPSIGTVNSMATNQSREARLVKIPSWMKLGK